MIMFYPLDMFINMLFMLLLNVGVLVAFGACFPVAFFHDFDPENAQQGHLGSPWLHPLVTNSLLWKNHGNMVV